MGPSGAGKTTLLNILAGRLSGGELSSDIRINKHKRGAFWKNIVGYVEQDDLLHPRLTVRETITNSAHLRLPRDLPKEEIEKRIDYIINNLGLKGVENSRIGNAEIRGVSGGERKRVSVAVELVTNPRILFLDEPTSGLDAFTAFTLVQTLQNLAWKEQKTMICTIHQPRSDILFLFSKLILLAGGKTVFMGTVNEAIYHYEALGLNCPALTNPGDFFIDNITVDFRSEESLNKSKQRIQKFQRKWSRWEKGHTRASLLYKKAIPAPLIKKSFQDLRQFWFVQFVILLKRELIMLWRDVSEWGTVTGQVTILSLFVGFSFFQLSNEQTGIQNRLGLLTFIIFDQIYFYAFPLVPTFAMERSLIKKERYSNMYNISAYYIAKVASLMPLLLLTTFILTAVPYYLVGLNPSASCFFIFFGILLCIGFSSTALGLCVGSVSPSVKTAIVICDLIIIIFIIYSGSFLNLSTVTWILRWLQYVSMAFYGYAALAQNEFSGLTFECNTQPCYETGQQVLEAYNLLDFPIFLCCIMVLVLGFLFLFGGYLGLYNATKPRIRLE
jgi:ABC-type multidrug transport system ATPase subunit